MCQQDHNNYNRSNQGELNHKRLTPYSSPLTSFPIAATPTISRKSSSPSASTWSACKRRRFCAALRLVSDKHELLRRARRHFVSQPSRGSTRRSFHRRG